MPKSSKKAEAADKDPPTSSDPEISKPESSKEAKTADKDPPTSDPEKSKPESSKEAKTADKDPPTSDPEKSKPGSSKEADKDPPSPSDPENPKPVSLDGPKDDHFVKQAKSEPTLTELPQGEAKPPARPTQSAPEPGEAEAGQDPLKEGTSQDQATPSKDKAKGVSSSVRQVLAYTMTGFFDWNPSYLTQMRGIFNILHMLMGVIVIVLLGVNCQLHTFPSGPSEGFFCQPPETFLFVSSIAAFLTSTIYLFCCMLSKKTEALLFETSFEISYYVLYFVLLLTSSSALLISAINWGSERMMYGNDYDLTHAAAIIGLINSIVYGLSAVIFFVSQRYHFYSSKSSTRV